MRRFAPSATARTMSRDYEYKGLQFKAGEKVYILPLLAGLDDRRFPNAWQVDFKRAGRPAQLVRRRPAPLSRLAAGQARDQGVPAGMARAHSGLQRETR